MSLGQLGKFSSELRWQPVIESVSIVVNFSRYSLSGLVSLSMVVSSRMSLSYFARVRGGAAYIFRILVLDHFLQSFLQSGHPVFALTQIE